MKHGYHVLQTVLLARKLFTRSWTILDLWVLNHDHVLWGKDTFLGAKTSSLFPFVSRLGSYFKNDNRQILEVEDGATWNNCPMPAANVIFLCFLSSGLTRPNYCIAVCFRQWFVRVLEGTEKLNVSVNPSRKARTNSLFCHLTLRTLDCLTSGAPNGKQLFVLNALDCKSEEKRAE